MGAGYVKYGYPIAVSTAMLAWGFIEFPNVSHMHCLFVCLSGYISVHSVSCLSGCTYETHQAGSQHWLTNPVIIVITIGLYVLPV